VLFVSCNQATLGYTGSNVGNQINGTYQLFNGTKTKNISAKEGNTIVIHFTSKVKKGALSIKVMDSTNNIVADLATNITTTREIIAEKNQNYQLVIKGVNTEGSFEINWDIN
jgi:hypothetical protein